MKFRTGSGNWTQPEIDQKLNDISSAFQVALVAAAIFVFIILIERIYIKHFKK